MSAVGIRTANASEFQSLVEPHLLAMRQLAIRLSSPGGGDRIVGRALRRAWCTRSRYDETERSLQAWLLALVASQARRDRRRPTEAGHQLVDLTDGVYEIDVEDRVDLDADIALLRWHQRLMIELFYTLELKVAVCAAVLGLTDGDAAELLAEAKQSLSGGVQQIELT